MGACCLVVYSCSPVVTRSWLARAGYLLLARAAARDRIFPPEENIHTPESFRDHCTHWRCIVESKNGNAAAAELLQRSIEQLQGRSVQRTTCRTAAEYKYDLAWAGSLGAFYYVILWPGPRKSSGKMTFCNGLLVFAFTLLQFVHTFGNIMT